MEIPYENLNKETLTRIIENFVAREGTDYGNFEFSLEDKVSQVMGKLQQGKAVITFDPESESCDIISREML